jgi:two-component system, cell cycle sensor histidine kinase and response regulator CckA
MGEEFKADHDRMKKDLALLRKENAALRRSLNHKENLVQELPLGFMVIQGGKIMDANAEILSQLGYSPEEVLHHGLRQFVPGRLKPLLGEILRKGRQGKRAFDPEEIELIGKDGIPVAWDIKVRKIRSSGRSAFLVLLIRNEERKKRAKNLVESAKAASLRTMASGLGAALKNPIRSVKECAGLVKQSLGPGREQEVERMEKAALSLETVGKAVECLMKETQEPSRRAPFDLRKVVKDALSGASLRVREEADKRAASITVKTYLRSVSAVEGDPDEIRQMLSNVIANAVEAMPGGGYLYLSTEENAGYAHIYIQDSGVGMPPQICERVFDPFFTTKGTENPGLGLSLSQAIIRRHRGEMEISSSKNEGTTVTVRLPLARREGQGAKKKPRKKGIRHARILIIEEAPMIGELLLQTLKSKGCGVEIAATATEGLAQARRKAFDLVIVGADISDVKGASLARRIKESKAPVPVALIGDDDDRDRRDLRHPPYVDLVITKPIDMTQAVKQITEVLNASS